MKRGRPPYDDVLTPRQWQVVALLQEGLTNEQIAARMGISADGAKYHVAEILSKLGVSSREEAARVVPQRRRFGFLPWLPSQTRRPTPLITAGVALVMVVALLALFMLGLPGSEGKRTSESASETGLDIAAASFPNTVLFSKGAPVNVATYGYALSRLRQVATADELRAALSPSIRLVVVDHSVLDEARRSGVLHGELGKGRAVLGLNVTNSDLRDVTALSMPGGRPAQTEIRSPSNPGPFYSYILQRGQGTNIEVFGGQQRYFFERVFETDLTRLDAGLIPDTGTPPLPVTQLPEERISVNRGMGCIYDDAKTAAVTKREVAALHPDLKVFGLMIAYCNPGPPGQVVMGVALPPPVSFVRITVPQAELMP
jgi:DNA-binding CsgD family transcriptional regulator